MQNSPEGRTQPAPVDSNEMELLPPVIAATADQSFLPSKAPMHIQRWFHSGVWLGIAFELGLGLLATAIGYVLSISLWDKFQFNLLPTLGYALATLPLIGALALLFPSEWQILREVRNFIETFVLPMFADARLWEITLLCAAAGFGEELLFRGALQPVCIKYLGLYGGVLLVNVFFSLMHPFSTAYVILAFLIGCYLSVLYVATDNLFAPMLVHGLYDLVALIWMMRRKS